MKKILKQKNGNVWIGLLLILVLLVSLAVSLVQEIINNIAQSKRAGQVQIAQSLCDAGIEKAIWKLNSSGGGTYLGETNLGLETGTVDIFVTNSTADTKEILTECFVPSKENSSQRRSVKVKATATQNETGAAFHYGVQVGGIGLTMSPNAKVFGNVYSAGNIICGNNANITGDVFASKNTDGTGTPRIDGCRVGGNASAHQIIDAQITGRAESVIWTRSSAGGGHTRITQADLKPYRDLPIDQSTIDIWKGWAAAGGSHLGNYRLTTGAKASLGPKRIQGDLILDGGSVLTLTGIIWVEGDVILNTNSSVNLTPSYGPNSGMIVADHPANRSLKGTIRASSNVNINGSGDPKSYILMASTNTRSTTNSPGPAIFAGNNSNAVVYYATTGMIEVNNNARLRAISGGGISLSNGAEVTYDVGLLDANFSAGPGGSWQISEWKIIY